MRFQSRTSAVGALCVLVGLAAAGCFETQTGPDRHHLPQPLIQDNRPVPSSASGVLRLLEWSYNHRALDALRELFTDDFRFVCSVLDSSGAPYRGTGSTREDEIISATHLFAGGADPPPARIIRLTLDKNFFVLRDDQFLSTDPTGRAHKQIATQTLLFIETTDGDTIEVSGAARFHLVRGDFALIPAELKDRGFGSDSTRWYIRRWADETVCRYLTCPTWCAIKLAYR